MGGEGVIIDEGKSHVISDPPPAATDNDDKGGSDSDGDGAEEVCFYIKIFVISMS